MHENIVHDFNNLLQVIQTRGELFRTELSHKVAPRGDEVILVVEDDPDVRHVVCEILELHGYTVYEAADGATAARIMEYLHPAPNLLLVDLMLPELSGLELIQELVQKHNLPRVLMMSACDTLPPHDLSDVEIPFISKPFQLEALAKRVRELLDESVTTLGP